MPTQWVIRGLVVKSKDQYARLLSTCWELCFSDSPSPCNFRLELVHRKAVCVLGGRREATVIIFWRLSLDTGCFWVHLFALPSFLMLALPKVIPGFHQTLCWQLTEVASMKSQQPSIDFVVPHAGFQSSLQVLTHLELSHCLQQHFSDLYLPSSSHHCVSTKLYHKLLLLYHS